MASLPNLNKLNDHEFVQNVAKNSMPVMKPDSKLSDFALGTKERYLGEVGFSLGQVLNQTDRIDQAGILLNSYPRIKAWQVRYGRFEYFQYHLEQYFIAVAGLVDRILLLANQIYQLGIPDDKVRFGSVLKELAKHQGEEELVVVLCSIRDSLAGVKRSKNNYTHAFRFWEKDLWHISLYEFSLKNKTVPDPDGFLQSDLDFESKIFRSKKMDLILKNEKALSEMLTRLYDVLNKAYLARIIQ